MRTITMYLLSFFAMGVAFGQEGVSSIKETANEQAAIKEATIRVIYADKTKKKRSGREYEEYINNILDGNSIDGFDLSGIEKDEIEDINIISYPGRDTGLAQMHITVKNNYLAKPISLTEVKNKYTNLGNRPAIFFIDETLIEGDYDKYMTDENGIYTITIDKLSNPKERVEIDIIKIKTRRNMEQKVILRGSSININTENGIL